MRCRQSFRAIGGSAIDNPVADEARAVRTRWRLIERNRKPAGCKCLKRAAQSRPCHVVEIPGLSGLMHDDEGFPQCGKAPIQYASQDRALRGGEHAARATPFETDVQQMNSIDAKRAGERVDLAQIGVVSSCQPAPGDAISKRRTYATCQKCSGPEQLHAARRKHLRALGKSLQHVVQ